MATNLIPSDYRTFLASELVSSVDAADALYYIFLGNHVPTANNPVSPNDTTADINDAYRNLILAKKISASDTSLIIRNVPYTSNTTYAMFDDTDTTLHIKDFYAVVNAGAFSHVWKVLDNNNEAFSTITPDFSQIDVDDTSYRTSDGYVWKYMYSVDSSTVSKFATAQFFPLQANTTTAQSAISGALQVFKIDEAGSGYSNWATGAFTTTDIRVGGNTRLFSVSNTVTVNGYYTGCNLYISSGVGVGQFKTIEDYFSNANGNFVVIDSDFTVVPQNASAYQIYPGVKITGTGQTINASARALVNSIGNTIYRIDVLAQGKNYSFANAQVIANNSVQVSQAAIRPIYAPYNGHGSDQASELNATRVSFSLLFSNTENGTVPATNSFRQIGLIRDPLFTNVVVNFSSSTTNDFVLNEPVRSFSYRLVCNTATTTINSANVTTNVGQLSQSFVANDWVFMQSISDTSMTFLSQISSVTNSSHMVLSANAPWSAQDIQLNLANVISGNISVLSLSSANAVTLTSVKGRIQSNNTLIGLQSGAFGTINTIQRNDDIKGFNTFIGMKKFQSNSVTGTFVENELVFQGPTLEQATSTALLHSTSLNNNTGILTIYTTNTVGTFQDSSNQIKGSNSNAIAAITNIYDSEVAFDSGKILYLENIAAVSRANNETEQINLVVEF